MTSAPSAETTRVGCDICGFAASVTDDDFGEWQTCRACSNEFEVTRKLILPDEPEDPDAPPETLAGQFAFVWTTFQAIAWIAVSLVVVIWLGSLLWRTPEQAINRQLARSLQSSANATPMRAGAAPTNATGQPMPQFVTRAPSQSAVSPSSTSTTAPSSSHAPTTPNFPNGFERQKADIERLVQETRERAQLAGNPAGVSSGSSSSGPPSSKSAQSAGRPIQATDSITNGMKLEVFWGNRWYPATVLDVAGQDRIKIHYDGWSDTWDRYVSRSELRFPL